MDDGSSPKTGINKLKKMITKPFSKFFSMESFLEGLEDVELSFLKRNGNGSSFLRGAFQRDLSVVIGCGMLDNGKTKTGTAGLPGVTFVHTVKAFKNTAVMFRRNADTGITDSQASVFDIDDNTAAGNIVFDGVVAKIVHRFLKKTADTC